MTADELRKRFPNISDSCLRETLGADPRLPDPKPERHQAPALGKAVQGKAQSIQRVVVRFTLRRVKLLDPDNAAGSSKDCLDGLRHAGLIPDDRPELISLQVEQEKVAHYKEEKTVIELIWP